MRWLIFTISYCGFEYLKISLIKSESVMELILIQIVRWLSVAALILVEKSISIAFFLPMCIIFFLYLRKYRYNSVSTKEKTYNYLLVNAISSCVNNMIINMALINVSVGIVGSLLAFRSATNFIPLILQYIETHLASAAKNKNLANVISKSVFLCILYISITLTLISIFTYEIIVSKVWGEDYLAHGELFPMLVFIVLVQAIGRIKNTELRHKGKTKVYMYNSLVFLLSTMFLVILTNFDMQSDILLSSILFIMVITPVIQSSISTLALRIK
ncbi:hypothetical protein AL542_04880 [Grimontia hollisae]|nr:hypothetical protein [Grimontia hollisae]AMG29792.1 hypothetical protein AL542_04880 [Grimontia hollisae]